MPCTLTSSRTKALACTLTSTNDLYFFRYDIYNGVAFESLFERTLGYCAHKRSCAMTVFFIFFLFHSFFSPALPSSFWSSSSHLLHFYDKNIIITLLLSLHLLLLLFIINTIIITFLLLLPLFSYQFASFPNMVNDPAAFLGDQRSSSRSIPRQMFSQR